LVIYLKWTLNVSSFLGILLDTVWQQQWR